MMPQKIIRDKNTNCERTNLPSIDKEKEEKSEHNVSNVAIYVVERRQERQSIRTQEIVVAYIFIAGVV